jgi:hypothetical protein
MKFSFRRPASLAFLCAVLACSSSASKPSPAGSDAGADGGTTGFEGTTASVTLSPTKMRQPASLGPNGAAPEALAMYLANGFGEQQEGAGQKHVTRVIDDSAAPTAGANAKRLLRFVHMPDLQIGDDESPTRLGSYDQADGTDAALRPQDAYLCAMTNAAVRTINGLHQKDPVGFVLLGGDNADSAQSNEVSWVLDILSGKDRVECDSGNDDDVVPGPNNDGKDPFRADGLKMPWKWVTGNHDVLVQGTVAINDSQKEVAVGNLATGGTRVYANGAKGALLRVGPVVADANRALLDRKALMARVADHGDGHGLSAAQKTTGKAIYTFDAPNTPLRFLILDSASETGGAEGMIHQADIDSTIRPALDLAKSDGKWVILASHHAADALTSNGGAFGTTQEDAVLPAAWKAFLGSYPNGRALA